VLLACPQLLVRSRCPGRRSSPPAFAAMLQLALSCPRRPSTKRRLPRRWFSLLSCPVLSGPLLVLWRQPPHGPAGSLVLSSPQQIFHWRCSGFLPPLSPALSLPPPALSHPLQLVHLYLMTSGGVRLRVRIATPRKLNLLDPRRGSREAGGAHLHNRQPLVVVLVEGTFGCVINQQSTNLES